MRNEAALVGQSKEAPNAFAAPLTVIHRPMVDVHCDEPIGEIEAHVAGELQGVLHRLGPMIEAELDAGGEEVGNLFAIGDGKSLVNDVAAERKRQTILRFVPPDSEVLTQFQALVLICELALM